MGKDKNAVVERLRARILPENRIFVRKNLAFSEQVETLLNEKGWSQKEFLKYQTKKKTLFPFSPTLVKHDLRPTIAAQSGISKKYLQMFTFSSSHFLSPAQVSALRPKEISLFPGVSIADVLGECAHFHGLHGPNIF